MRGRAWPGCALAVLAFAALDALYLGWVWAQFGNWGFWDWDLQETLLEAARRSLVEYGQLPLWNPYMGGGVTLVGHPLARTFNPSFAPVLLFGTAAGVKLCLFLYLLIAQWGTYRLARAFRVTRPAAGLAALIFSLGGAHAQHLAHGHFEWLGYAWLPFAWLGLERAARRFRIRHGLLGGGALALLFLDGGPYQLCFAPLFLGLWAGLRALQLRSVRPLGAAAACTALAAALAAVHLVPVAETWLDHPRQTPARSNFYDAPFEPGAGRILWEGYLSQQQSHDPRRWMPFLVNVGCYVGPLPILFAGLGLVRAPRRAWPLAAALAAALWISLGPAAPVDLWALLHRLPGFASLQVPARFNVFALLALGLLAALGFDALDAPGRRGRRLRALAAAAGIAAALDLLWVNAPIFRAAFSVPPLALREPAEFFHHRASPYQRLYRERALVPVWDNWPNATFPTTLENTGVIDCYGDLDYPRRALAAGEPGHPGREAWGADPGVRVEAIRFTPNRIELRTAGSGGRVVVNQNHHRGWRVAGAAAPGAEAWRGLLSAVVPAGERRVVFEFAPRSFALGAAISAAALLLAAVLALAGRRVSSAG